MGIQDRDYYRDHHRKVSSLNRKRDAWSTGRVALFWIAALAIAFAVIRLAPVLLPAPAVPSPPSPSAPAPARATRPPSPPRSLATEPSTTDSRASPSTDAAPIYRCGNSYGLAPCAQGRTVAGPAASGFDSRPSEALARLVADGRSRDSETVATTVPIARSPNAVECQALAAEIAAIDREARQPLFAQQQDYLRDKRRRARDRQIALRC